MSTADILTAAILMSVKKKRMHADTINSTKEQPINRTLFDKENSENYNNNLQSNILNIAVSHLSSRADILTNSLTLSSKKKKVYETNELVDGECKNISSIDQTDILARKSLFVNTSFDLRRGGSLREYEGNENTVSSNEHHIIDDLDPNEQLTTIVITSSSNYECDNNTGINNELDDSRYSQSQYCSDDLDQEDNNSQYTQAMRVEDLHCLRDRAGQAVHLQIVDILNHGDTEEVHFLNIQSISLHV